VSEVRERAAAAAQVLVPDPSAPEIAPSDLHHLVRVLRLRAGEQVVATDGQGRWARCRLRDDPGAGTPRGRWWLDPEEDVRFEPAPFPPVTVAFAPVKGDRPEWVVQKLTELGVDRIVPLRTARSVVRWDGDRAVAAVDRLRRVAVEAAAQCRRVRLPEVSAVTGLDGLPGVALAELGGSAPTLDLPCVAVGPEGGWSDDEREPGRPLVGLGPTVLRAETAAVAAGVVMTALRAGTVSGGVDGGTPTGPTGVGG
jgi:16S rRNA (uracil1498-N3)-methyltransferase